MEEKGQVVRMNFGKEPYLSDFSNWRNQLEEIILVNGPIFSKYVVQEYDQRKHDKKRKYGSFAIKGGKLAKCFVSEWKNDIDDCNLYLQFDL